MRLFHHLFADFLSLGALLLAVSLVGCKKDESVILRPAPVASSDETVVDSVEIPVDSSSVDSASVDTASVDTASVDTTSVDTASVDTAIVDSAVAKPQTVEVVPASKKRFVFLSRRAEPPKDTLDSLALQSTPTEPDSAAVVSCSDVDENEFCDPRDGKHYDIVVIGRQTWFRRNLAYETEGSWCPNDREENCIIYGRLYQWDAAKSCPEGWRLPSMRDFTILHDYIFKKNAGEEGVGTSLKTIVGWNDNENEDIPVGTNRYGFGAKPAGYRDNRGLYVSVGDEANFWTSQEIIGENRASYWNLYYGNQDFIGSYVGLKSSAMSVRCIKN